MASEFEYDVVYDDEREQDVIMLDIGDEVIYLTREELSSMLEMLS